jgi:two-component system response regulator
MRSVPNNPQPDCMESSPQATESLLSRVAGACPRVLLVEDDSNDVELIQRAFEEFEPQFQLQVARNGKEAMALLGAATARLPQLILTDINMPLVNGFEFLQWLKTKSGCRRTPVIVISASDAPRDVACAYDLGAASYLVKPSTFEVLTARLEALLIFWSVNEWPPADSPA